MELNDIKALLEYFVKGVYKPNSANKEGKEIMQKCRDLMGLDYVYSIVMNTDGELTGNYPSHLIILEQEKCKVRPASILDNRRLCSNLRTTPERPERPRENAQLRELITNAKLARVWSRFPVPVILFEGKNICRSSTLASSVEIMGRRGLNYFFTASEKLVTTEERDLEAPSENEQPPSLADASLQVAQGEASGCQAEVRNQDILLLKRLNVNTIVDLMVEKRKVKFGLYVTSSEKVDKENRYAEFTLLSLPYPGCEFFKAYYLNNYDPTNLYFDWNQPYVDAGLGVPKDSVTQVLNIDWTSYKKWELVTLSRNYIRLILRYIAEHNSGILVHCISGWDRTPLFISLLRLTLWADGHIHRSLNAYQMVYLTVAYDWLLFGHNLLDRTVKCEDIMLFCFNFVKFLIPEDFSIPHRRRNGDSESTMGSASLSGSNMSLSSVTSLEQLQLSSDDSHVNGNSCRASPLQTSGASSEECAEGSSPMAVPSASKLRERNESISSTGSWQFITPTGSFTPNSPMAAFNANGASELHESTQSTDSAGTVMEDETLSTNVLADRRAKRLDEVRSIFYNAYWSTVRGTKSF